MTIHAAAMCQQQTVVCVQALSCAGMTKMVVTVGPVTILDANSNEDTVTTNMTPSSTYAAAAVVRGSHPVCCVSCLVQVLPANMLRQECGRCWQAAVDLPYGHPQQLSQCAHDAPIKRRLLLGRCSTMPRAQHCSLDSRVLCKTLHLAPVTSIGCWHLLCTVLVVRPRCCQISSTIFIIWSWNCGWRVPQVRALANGTT
jgi:hypothetical protein